MNELKLLLHNNELVLGVTTMSCGSVSWVLRSARQEEDIYCAFNVDDNCSLIDVVDFFLKPATQAIIKFRNKQEVADE